MAKPVDRQLLTRWLAELPDKLPPTAEVCRSLTMQNVLESFCAVMKFPRVLTAYHARLSEHLCNTQWLRICRGAITTCRIALFNHAIFFCLAKTASQVDTLRGHIHPANQTTLLSIVNTDNYSTVGSQRVRNHDGTGDGQLADSNAERLLGGPLCAE